MNFLELLAASVLIGLASAGVWRIPAVDAITKPMRAKVFTETRDESGGRLYSWLKLWYKCPWCAGAWVTAAITIATDQIVQDGLPAPLLVFAAARYITGWIGSHDEDYQTQMMRGEP